MEPSSSSGDAQETRDLLLIGPSGLQLTTRELFALRQFIGFGKWLARGKSKVEVGASVLTSDQISPVQC